MNPASDVRDLSGFLSHLSAEFLEYSNSVVNLLHYTSMPIESEDEVLERAEAMDHIMDMAQHKNDVVLLFVNAIADRIQEFEDSMEMPDIPVPERLRELMKIKQVKQTDLKAIATQSVISEILNGKREVNLKQAKGFAEFFNVPLERFVA